MQAIKIDRDLCTRCGACVKECPTFALGMGTGYPEAIFPQNCFACGHCMAVCPVGAFFNGKVPSNAETNKNDNLNISADSAEQFLRSRRSIRNYLDKPVPRELLLRLVDLARHAPTASNAQGISFIIVEDKNKVRRAAESAVECFEKGPPSAQSEVSGLIQVYRRKGIDGILRDAPHVVLTIADREFRQGREASISMLTYLELFAPALGLGSCWAGIFERCALSGYRPLMELLQVPEGKKITGAVMVGYPRYSYKRIPARNPLEASFR